MENDEKRRETRGSKGVDRSLTATGGEGRGRTGCAGGQEAEKERNAKEAREKARRNLERRIGTGVEREAAEARKGTA